MTGDASGAVDCLKLDGPLDDAGSAFEDVFESTSAGRTFGRLTRYCCRGKDNGARTAGLAGPVDTAGADEASRATLGGALATALGLGAWVELKTGALTTGAFD
jgi:hypothetical protein